MTHIGMSSIKMVNHDCFTGCKCSSLLKFVLVMRTWPFCPSRTNDFLWYVFSLAPVSPDFPQSSRVPRVLCLSRIKPINPWLFHVSENSFHVCNLHVRRFSSEFPTTFLVWSVYISIHRKTRRWMVFPLRLKTLCLLDLNTTVFEADRV